MIVPQRPIGRDPGGDGFTLGDGAAVVWKTALLLRFGAWSAPLLHEPTSFV